MEFSGFTQQTFAFFMELAFSNTVQTFNKNRGVFEEQVIAPLKALSRFSHNKMPYRDYMWLDFRRKNEDCHMGFCFSISPRSSFALMGMHEATPQYIGKMRQYIVQFASQFIELHADLLGKGFSLEGDDYKKPMTSNVSPEVYAIGQKRRFAYQKFISISETMQGKFAQELQDHIRDLTPMYAFLRKAFD
jgi:uncharacterized protein (DUF2461 family)